MKNSSNAFLAFLLSVLLHALILYSLLGISLHVQKEQEKSPIVLELTPPKIPPKPENKIQEHKHEPVQKIEPKEEIKPKEQQNEQKIETQEIPPLPSPQEKKREIPVKESQSSEPPKPQKQKNEPSKVSPKESNTTKEQPKPTKTEPSFVAPSIEEIGDAFEGSELGKLYGDEFKSFTKEQKEFIKENLKDIGTITQRYLRYPEIAGRMGQEGVNVVEFFLHPNGDISELKLITTSGFGILDKNSIHTIEVAYKDYPRPKTATKVRIFVHYNLY